MGVLPDVAGIDVGLSLLAPTSGVCRTGHSGDILSHTYIDRLSRSAALGAPHRFAVLAIDGPVLPGGMLHYFARPCEKVFVWGAFQRRCKCGESHIRGTGHEGTVGGDVADQGYPRVLASRNIVEAFPNAFLGVSLPDAVFTSALARGEKFDWLYEQWLLHNGPEQLRAVVSWERDIFWQALRENQHHDERAALICALTAICAIRVSYVAVGETAGGYFFLPPWNVWAPWARLALDINRIDRRLPAPVDVWIDGIRYGPSERLPM